MDEILKYHPWLALFGACVPILWVVIYWLKAKQAKQDAQRRTSLMTHAQHKKVLKEHFGDGQELADYNRLMKEHGWTDDGIVEQERGDLRKKPTGGNR